MFPLTVTELRKSVDYPTGADGDAALQLMLDAAEEAIVKRAGAVGAVTELVTGGWTTLVLDRPIASVASVTVDYDGTPLVLAVDDYRFNVGGYVLRRLSGTNSAYDWAGTVRVTYTPVDDTDTREMAQVGLVRLYISSHPGLVSQTIGDWSETFASGDYSYTAAVEEILATLDAGHGMVVV